jgi:transcriptional regulator with XRE-family HTH domain
MPTAVAEMLDVLKNRGGLRGTDIANVVSVSPATVSRWVQGKIVPQAKTELLISDLRYIASRLSEFYSPDEVRVWLYSRHRLLNDQRAIDLIQDGRADQVLEVIASLDAGAFT